MKFTFLYDDESRQWKLSPAYDMTYSNMYYGEHTTTVNGNGKNPGVKDLCQVGIKAGMKKKVCEQMIYHVKECVEQDLKKYI